jgi:hypothetical protein
MPFTCPMSVIASMHPVSVFFYSQAFNIKIYSSTRLLLILQQSTLPSLSTTSDQSISITATTACSPNSNWRFCRLNEQHPMMFNQQDIVDEVNITSCNKAIKLICNILDRSLASLPRTRLPLSIVGSIAYVSNTTLSPTTNPSTVFFGWRLL